MKKKGNEAVEAVKKFSRNSKVEALKLDLSSLKSIREFAKKFEEKKLPLNILINNAGVMMIPYAKTEDGFEMQFGVNHLGHFLLTNLLLDKLKQSKGRIVNVSSEAQTMGKIPFDDLSYEKGGYSKIYAYCNSKTANVLFTVELQRRLAGTGVEAFSLHPGAVATELARNLNVLIRGVFSVGMSLLGKTPVQGAQTSIYAAISPSLQGKGGAYLQDCRIKKAAPQSTDPETAKKLWEISAKLVGLN